MCTGVYKICFVLGGTVEKVIFEDMLVQEIYLLVGIVIDCHCPCSVHMIFYLGIVTIPVSMYQSMTGTPIAIDPTQLTQGTTQLTPQQIQQIQSQLQPHLAQQIGQITMVSASEGTQPDVKPQTSAVPDATQAVEVMSVDQPQ